MDFCEGTGYNASGLYIVFQGRKEDRLMRYSIGEKRRLDNILKIFEDYIRGQDYFDIAYSEKIGYIWVMVRDPTDFALDTLDTPEELLGALYNNIIHDVVFSPDNPKQNHDHLILTEYEKTEIRRRITEIMDTVDGTNKGCYLDFLDIHIEAYQKDDLQRRPASSPVQF